MLPAVKLDFHSFMEEDNFFAISSYSEKENKLKIEKWLCKRDAEKMDLKKLKCFIFVFWIFYLTYSLQAHILNFWCINFQTLFFVDWNLIVEGSILFCPAALYKDWEFFSTGSNCEQRQYKGRKKTNPKPKRHMSNLHRHLVHSSLFAMFPCAVKEIKQKCVPSGSLCQSTEVIF